MVEEKTWEEFKNTGLIWWINMFLQVFGYSIVITCKDGETVAYPARVAIRGFSKQANTVGYKTLQTWLKDNIETLCEEAQQ